MDVRVIIADITKQKVDAIVNAANKWCLGGSGVDGAIHNAAGPVLLQECRKLAADASGVRCPTGEARITGAGDLPCKFVIHTVGPDCSDVADKSEQDRLLASAYAASLWLAKENGVKTIAFPSISTGIFGFPIERAAKIVAKTVGDFLTNEPEMSVTMCIFDPDTATEKKLVDAYTNAFADYDGTALGSSVPVPGSVAYEMTEEDYEFLGRVSLDLAFIVQRINRQLSEGRDPKPGKVALKGYESIDPYILWSLAKADNSGQAARLWGVYVEVGKSGKDGWRRMVLKEYWKPKLYDMNNPSLATSMSEWGFDRSKVSVCSCTVKARKKPNAGFPDALTAEMLRVFDMKKKGSTHPHHGYIDGVHYIAKCAKWGEEIFPTVPTSDGHVHNEYLADCFLREAGLNVPESREYWVDFGDGKGLRVVRLARYIEDTQPLEDAFKMTDSPSAMADRVLAAYPIQSFIAGIDTFQNDNVIVDREGTLWYVDNGASFDYRATGPTKGWWFDRSDVDDPNTGYLALRNFPNALQLQMMLKMSDDELWKAGADFDFIALAEKLPPELKKPAVLEYARLLNERMKRLVK